MQVAIDETSSYEIFRWVEVYTERVGSQVDLHHTTRESVLITQTNRDKSLKEAVGSNWVGFL